MIQKPIYLGDGLYAQWDGYQLTLLANDPYNPTDTVYLEDNVIMALLDYLRQCGFVDQEK